MSSRKGEVWQFSTTLLLVVSTPRDDADGGMYHPMLDLENGVQLDGYESYPGSWDKHRTGRRIA